MSRFSLIDAQSDVNHIRIFGLSVWGGFIFVPGVVFCNYSSSRNNIPANAGCYCLFKNTL